jgi:hypothetical protein
MPAVTVSLSRTDGFLDFYCFRCGAPILVADDGVADKFCQHVTVFVDWVGEATVAEGSRDELTDELDEVDPTDPTELAELFTDGTVIFELVEPARGAGHDGSTCLIAMAIDEEETDD